MADPSAYERANYMRTIHSWSVTREGFDQLAVTGLKPDWIAAVARPAAAQTTDRQVSPASSRTVSHSRRRSAADRRVDGDPVERPRPPVEQQPPGTARAPPGPPPATAIGVGALRGRPQPRPHQAVEARQRLRQPRGVRPARVHRVEAHPAVPGSRRAHSRTSAIWARFARA